jgi:D-alanyl-D-alanine carboxypeptidase
MLGSEARTMTAKGLLALLGAAAGALLGAPAAAPAAPAKPLTAADVARIHRFMDVSPFDRGTWGLLVSDLDTGRELYRQNATTKFQAASTTKNFTTAAALDILGRNRRFRTPVVRTGRVSHSGTLAGDLVLVASGDMTMGGRLKGDATARSPTPASTTPTPTRSLGSQSSHLRTRSEGSTISRARSANAASGGWTATW